MLKHSHAQTLSNPGSICDSSSRARRLSLSLPLSATSYHTHRRPCCSVKKLELSEIVVLSDPTRKRTRVGRRSKKRRPIELRGDSGFGHFQHKAVVSPIYYAMFTSFTIFASAIMFKDWSDQSAGSIASVLCGFITLLSGVMVLHSTREPETLPTAGKDMQGRMLI